MKRRPRKTDQSKLRPKGARGRGALSETNHRRPGRPTGAENGLINRQVIIAVAFQLARAVSLRELSIVKVARELGVTPALIHYYLEGRNALTSGVMNAFYREVVEDWPPPVSAWKDNLEVVAHSVYRSFIRYPGVASYVVSHNRFRMVQEVRDGEADYGILFFEKFTSTVRAAGFDAVRTGLYAHLLMDFIVANAHATVRHRWPGEHGDFLSKKLAELDPVEFPGAHFVRESFTRMNASSAFTIGLGLFLQALQHEREKVAQNELEKPASS